MCNILKIITILFAIIAFTSCIKVSCGNEVIKSIPSPHERFKVVIFKRNCGATTGFNTQVSIVKFSDELPNEGGNTYIAEGDQPIIVLWKNEDQLVIKGIGTEPIFKQESIVLGVPVVYEP